MNKQVIIFDCFGVLATGTWQRYIDSLPPTIDRQPLHDLNRAHDAGMLSDDDYMFRLKDLTGSAPQRIEDIKLGDIAKNTALLKYIATLQGRYKLGILSNIASDWITAQLLDPAEQALFDDIVESFRVGITKPHADIFYLAAERLGVPPGVCVFIDDNEDNARAAEAVGMYGLVYSGLHELQETLDTILADGANTDV
jgi:HAD superfamily hydrolase (TIGR01549 family)